MNQEKIEALQELERNIIAALDISCDGTLTVAEMVGVLEGVKFRILLSAHERVNREGQG